MVLQEAEQRDLCAEAERLQLVEKQRAAFGLLDDAGSRLLGVGERAACVPEELALDQAVGNGAAVDRDERLLAPRAEVVNRARRELLAGARLTCDEDRRVATGEPANHLQRAEERRRFADEIQPHELRGIRGEMRGEAAPWSVELWCERHCRTTDRAGGEV